MGTRKGYEQDRQYDEVWRWSHKVGERLHESDIVWTGFSVKFRQIDVLVVLRGVLAGGRVVAFVDGEDLGACMRKVQGRVSQDMLQWKPDKFE